MPHYYRDFVTQAEQVKEHLFAIGEPEAARGTGPAPIEEAIDVTRLFSEAASRHRDELSPG
jgi:hypothetical protein